jgi:hypothetical protein
MQIEGADRGLLDVFRSNDSGVEGFERPTPIPQLFEGLAGFHNQKKGL